jgi:hypothetical protein
MEILYKDGRYCKECSKCGAEQSYNKRSNCVIAIKKDIPCLSCGQRNNHKKIAQFYRGIRIAWFKRFERNAINRDIEWDITLDDVADMFELQGGLCALTNVDISFPTHGHAAQCPASIDRLNNKKGYTVNNIQLTLGAVNMMRGSYSVEQFIEVCKKVASATAIE